MSILLDPHIQRWAPAMAAPECKQGVIYDTPERPHQLLFFMLLDLCEVLVLQWLGSLRLITERDFYYWDHNLCFLQIQVSKDNLLTNSFLGAIATSQENWHDSSRWIGRGFLVFSLCVSHCLKLLQIYFFLWFLFR